MIKGPPVALDLTQVIPQLLSNLLRHAISARYIIHVENNKETLTVVYYVTQYEVRVTGTKVKHNSSEHVICGISIS